MFVRLHFITFFFLKVRNHNHNLFLIFTQILTHSRVRDGIWLTPENLREIYTGLKADKDNNGKTLHILMQAFQLLNLV